MHSNGLNKLMEECGELVQIAAKKQAYPNTDHHPDGKGSMSSRLEEECADVCAAILFVAENYKFDTARMNARIERKLALFNQWHKGDE